MGSISVIKTRAPYERRDSAHYGPLSATILCTKLKLTYALADITKASDNGNLAGQHDIGSTLDAIDEGLAAAVVVVYGSGSLVNPITRACTTNTHQTWTWSLSRSH